MAIVMSQRARFIVHSEQSFCANQAGRDIAADCVKKFTPTRTFLCASEKDFLLLAQTHEPSTLHASEHAVSRGRQNQVSNQGFTGYCHTRPMKHELASAGWRGLPFETVGESGVFVLGNEHQKVTQTLSIRGQISGDPRHHQPNRNQLTAGTPMVPTKKFV